MAGRGWLVVGAALGIWAGVAAGRTTVVIKVKTPPDIDPATFRNVAVLPFKGEEDWGYLAAKKTREKLEGKGLFRVEAAETVETAIDRAVGFVPGEREGAIKLGRALGVDLVLTGEVEFRTQVFSPEGDVRNELYTADRQTIPPFEWGSSYATRNLEARVAFVATLTIKALDVNSGRLVRRRRFEKASDVTVKQRELLSLPGEEDRKTFEELLDGVVSDFIFTLDTHDVEEEREVVVF